jgi:hypothetical protein
VKRPVTWSEKDRGVLRLRQLISSAEVIRHRRFFVAASRVVTSPIGLAGAVSWGIACIVPTVTMASALVGASCLRMLFVTSQAGATGETLLSRSRRALIRTRQAVFDTGGGSQERAGCTPWG